MFVPDNASALHNRPPHSKISQNDWDILSKFWYPVCLTSEVTDTPFKAKLLDVELVLFRSGEDIVAMIDMCPHRWIRLSAGTIVDGNIQCAFHGLTFDPTGKCVRVPCLGRSARLPSSYRVQTFRTQLRHAMVWVCLDDESEAVIPPYPTLAGVHDSALTFGAVMIWPMSAPRQIENFFDIGHLPFVHATTLGGDPFARLDPPKIEERNDSLIFTAKYVETVPFDKPTEMDFTYQVFLPFSIDFQTKAAGKELLKSVNIATPVNAHECRVFQLIRRGNPGDIFDGPPRVLDRQSGGAELNQQDIDILVELAIPDMPLTEKLEIHLPVDNVSNAYRRRLRALGLGRS